MRTAKYVNSITVAYNGIPSWVAKTRIPARKMIPTMIMQNRDSMNDKSPWFVGGNGPVSAEASSLGTSLFRLGGAWKGRAILLSQDKWLECSHKSRYSSGMCSGSWAVSPTASIGMYGSCVISSGAVSSRRACLQNIEYC